MDLVVMIVVAALREAFGYPPPGPVAKPEVVKDWVAKMQKAKEEVE